MNRRGVLKTSAVVGFAAVYRTAAAHHGWSSFDQEKPIYLEGTVIKSSWQNPHAELQIDLPAGLKVPADLARRALPAQSAPVDGKALLAKAVVPTRQDKRWEIELAPLSRMQAWNVAEIKPGASVAGVYSRGRPCASAPAIRAGSTLHDPITMPGLRREPYRTAVATAAFNASPSDFETSAEGIVMVGSAPPGVVIAASLLARITPIAPAFCAFFTLMTKLQAPRPTMATLPATAARFAAFKASQPGPLSPGW